jgi:hypothetical protein
VTGEVEPAVEVGGDAGDEAEDPDEQEPGTDHQREQLNRVPTSSHGR